MGNQPQKAPPRPTLEDAIIDMRMAAKRFEMEAKRAEKESKKELEKARNAIKKNNDEGAKLFLQMAASKQKEAQNCQRMAHKMDALSSTIKNNTNSVTMTEQLNKITPILQFQAQNVPLEQMQHQMDAYQKAMDDIMVTGKMMDEVVNNQNADTTSDMAVDQMFQQLKNEQYNEIGQGLNTNNNGLLFNDLQKPQQLNQNSNDLAFMNDLKKS